VLPLWTWRRLRRRAQGRGAKAAFKGYHGYPCVLCASVNSEVVHGIPSRKRVLKEGDIVSLDFGAVVDGYFGDSAITVAVGAKIAPETERLLRVTEVAAIGDCGGQAGGDPGRHRRAVQGVVEPRGFRCKGFVGHGIGVHMHEDPQVPNLARPVTA